MSMKMANILGTMGLCLFSSLLLAGQDLKKDLQAMATYLKEVDQLHLDVSVGIYRTSTSAAPHMEPTVQLYKKGKNYYYHLQETEMFVTPTSLIMVQEATKRILYRTIAEKEYKQLLRSMSATAADTLIQQYDSIRYKGTEKKGKHYIIYTSSKVIQRTEVYLNPSTYMMEKVVYHYDPVKFKEFKRVDIQFVTRGLQPPELENYLKESAFVGKGGKKTLLPGERYKGYRVEVIENP